MRGCLAGEEKQLVLNNVVLVGEDFGLVWEDVRLVGDTVWEDVGVWMWEK